MATRPQDPVPPFERGGSNFTRITIDLLPDGQVRIGSVCCGRFDSSYAPMPEQRAPAEVHKLLGELRQRLAGASPVSAPPGRGAAHGACGGFAASGSVQADLAQAAVGDVALQAQDALLSAIEARLTKEVRGLVAALDQFGRRAQLIGKDIPEGAKFCQLVTSSLALLGFQFAYSFNKGLDTPIFFDDGAKYLADLGLSLDEFVREVSLDGRRFLAVALIDQELPKLDSAADAGDKQ